MMFRLMRNVLLAGAAGLMLLFAAPDPAQAQYGYWGGNGYRPSYYTYRYRYRYSPWAYRYRYRYAYRPYYGYSRPYRYSYHYSYYPYRYGDYRPYYWSGYSPGVYGRMGGLRFGFSF